MYGIMSGMQMLLLQQQPKYFKDDNPVEAMILLIGIGAVILISVLFHFIRSSLGTTAGKNRTAGVASKRFGFFTISRIATAYGLDRDQSKLLEYVFRNDSVSDPERAMKNPTLLDRHFKRTYKIIEKNSESEDDIQNHLVKLFSLRNAIEASPGNDVSPSSQLRENTPAVLSDGNDSYPVKVISYQSQIIIVEIPRNSLGTPVKLSKGARVTLSFYTKSSKGFFLEGHITSAITTIHGPGIQIAHNGKIKALAKRKFRRRQTTIRCEFFLVNVEETGKRSSPKLVVDKKRFTGTLLDIGIGGCSIKTNAPVQVGSRLKIVINYNDNYAISVLGQVLRANRSGAAGSIIHIKFLKVPRRAYNSINAMVYGYNE